MTYDWSQDSTRGPWARNSLKYLRDEMLEKARRCGHNYTQTHPLYPAADFVRETYMMAAELVQRRLDLIQKHD